VENVEIEVYGLGGVFSRCEGDKVLNVDGVDVFDLEALEVLW
jgi:hypothetical protein